MITSLIICVLTALTMVAVDRYGRNSRLAGRSGTIQSRQIEKKVVDTPEEAYRLWREGGYRGRTVVYVSGRWESFDPGELLPAQMFRAYPLELYNTARLFEDDYLNGVTFLYVAALNKICRRIVAIIPESEIGGMQEMARRSKDAEVSDKKVFITRQGYPRWFVSAAGFSAGGEPVLLYVGASYFRNGEPEELYGLLAASGVQTDLVILCKEKGKDSVTDKEIARLHRFARLMGISTPSAGGDGMTGSGSRLRPGNLPVS